MRMRNTKQPLVAIASIVALMGIVLLYVTPAEPQYQGRRLASIIIISCSGVNYTVIMAVIGTNTAGFTRKQLSTSTAFFLYCIVNIVSYLSVWSVPSLVNISKLMVSRDEILFMASIDASWGCQDAGILFCLLPILKPPCWLLDLIDNTPNVSTLFIWKVSISRT